jgi:hypothetical protein
MSDKKSFILYTDTLSVLDELTNEQAGILFKAIKDFQNGIEPDLDFGLKMAFLPLKNQFIRDSEKWDTIKQVRKNAGLKGGRPPKAKKANGYFDNQNKPNESKAKQNNPVNVNDNVNVNVNVNGSVNDNVNAKRKINRESVYPILLEVENFFFENGFKREAGKKAFEYYSEAGWKDSKGSQVKNWKQKMRGVWFKDENKISNSQTPKMVY